MSARVAIYCHGRLVWAWRCANGYECAECGAKIKAVAA